ncbi:PfkB family carbohydrate kinase [Pseudarthrobacter sp.]|uniref:PfkB family carbohydrate kinase n=1 Tax=Pseudarthrobacter sp. TaxID=1934409 RepID=UPI002FCA5A04
MTHYADDPYGHMIEEHLSANGVTAIGGGSARTSTAIATLGPDGGATHVFDISWDINGAALPALEAVQDSKHVHTGSIAAVLGPGDQATYGLLEAARERATISFNPTLADTVGAGDSFMAALISGLDQLAALGAGGRQRLQSLSHDELHALAAYANGGAAITCSRPGANPPHSAELGPLSVPLRTQLGH